MKKLKKILLVDDDKVNNYLNEVLLKELNIAENITILTNGKSALEHLVENCESEADESICPQLVILDHLMPIMDGLEMMERLKSRNFINTQRIVFILLGVHSTEAQIEAFKKLGVHMHCYFKLSGIKT